MEVSIFNLFTVWVSLRGEVIEFEQTGHGYAAFGLLLPITAGSDSLHLLILSCLQVLRFTFESALQYS
jgi:hypothetical protein